jgi:tRNA pseudouridine55 synthase
LSEINGILIVDKPRGMTSHDVVDFIRRHFKIKKAGHAGTLDPAATGVLVILIGKATKRSLGLTGADKEYEAVLTLGRKTDSGDAEGKVLFESDVSKVTGEDVRRVFKSFEGEIEQVPPMVSALRYKGERLYELARKGKEVPREPRKIHIKEMRIKKAEIPNIDFSVTCSKGTYIRTLCEDIGDKLGCGGYLSYLRRVRSGGFTLDGSVDMDKLKSFSIDELKERLIDK